MKPTFEIIGGPHTNTDSIIWILITQFFKISSQLSSEISHTGLSEFISVWFALLLFEKFSIFLPLLYLTVYAFLISCNERARCEHYRSHHTAQVINWYFHSKSSTDCNLNSIKVVIIWRFFETQSGKWWSYNQSSWLMLMKLENDKIGLLLHKWLCILTALLQDERYSISIISVNTIVPRFKTSFNVGTTVCFS